MYIRSISIVAVISSILVMVLPSDCIAGSRIADPIYTFIPSEGIGNIAVRIESPELPRYPEGAPVVVEVSTWFVNFSEFHRVNDTRRIGAVTVSYLWPGRFDSETELHSDGEYDYGGPVSLSALKDVIRFASGLTQDVDGNSISDLATVTVMTENIGLFASSHSGVVATNVLAYFGSEIESVKYLVGRENPTRDEMYPLELGHFDGSPTENSKVNNLFYDDESYLTDSVIVDYSTLGWYQPEGEMFGRPYFAAKDLIPEHILAPDKIPNVYNKRYYSQNLTRALLDNGALTLENWPDYLATPSETATFWPYRITVHNYGDICDQLPDLKVMLVFSRYDHVQTALRKPHIHQAWDGFYSECGFWVRLNTDRAYAQSVDPNYGQAFPDNLANREPNDWIYIEDWGFPTDSRVRFNMWLASVAEMADRVYMNDWSDNLDSVFFPVLVDSGNTNVEDIVIPGNAPSNQFSLHNTPNPFTGETVIKFTIKKKSTLSLDVYDYHGSLLQNLSTGEYLPGSYQVTFNGFEFPAGVYFYKLQTDGTTDVGRMILAR